MAAANHPLVVDDKIDVDRACDAIGSAWYKTINSLFDVVALFRTCLGKKGFKELQLELENRGIMKNSVFSMFKKIAQNPAIDFSIKENLPPSYNALYYLSRIEDQEVLKKLIADGEISRHTTLEDAKKLYTKISGSSQASYEEFKPTPSIMSVASIKIQRDEFKRNRKRIFELLDELEKLGLVIKRSDEIK